VFAAVRLFLDVRGHATLEAHAEAVAQAQADPDAGARDVP
jgi:hypothetical protein